MKIVRRLLLALRTLLALLVLFPNAASAAPFAKAYDAKAYETIRVGYERGPEARAANPSDPAPGPACAPSCADAVDDDADEVDANAEEDDDASLSAEYAPGSLLCLVPGIQPHTLRPAGLAPARGFENRVKPPPRG